MSAQHSSYRWFGQSIKPVALWLTAFVIESHRVQFVVRPGNRSPTRLLAASWRKPIPQLMENRLRQLAYGDESDSHRHGPEVGFWSIKVFGRFCSGHVLEAGAFRRLTLGLGYCHLKLALSLTRLPYHLDQDFSGLQGIAHLAQKCNARSMHTILGSQANLEAEAIDRGHLRFLRLNTSKPFGK